MAEVSCPHISNFPSLSSVIFTPDNHIDPSLLPPLSLSESDLSYSDSEPEIIDFDSEMEPKVEPLGCDYTQENDDQSTFVNNLFHSSENDPISDPPPCLSLGEGMTRMGASSEVDLELGLGLASYSESVVSPSPQPTVERRRFEGLRVVSVDSDSESDDVRDFEEIDDGFSGVSDFDRPPFCWDYLGFNNLRNNNDNNQVNEREIQLTDNDDDGGDFFLDDGADDGERSIQLDTDDTEREVNEVSILFDTYQERVEQEIMIQSETDEGGEFDVEEAIRDLEWEILLAVNNFNREVFDMDINVDMYDAILTEVEERMNDWRGSPPAANSVIENLPIVRLSAECLKENDIVCAICKDDISGEEKVRQLPCSHYYHGECILPWLKMRNTCPVCRHELPTDDPEYEHRKREREGLSGHGDGDGDGDVSLNSQSPTACTMPLEL